jgi:ribonuclease HII
MRSFAGDDLEKVLLQTGYDYIIGVDEVGRGSWAGPLVVAAFVYQNITSIFDEVNDSKQLTIRKRERLYQKLKKQSFSIAQAEVEEIDKFNVLQATRLAINRAVENLNLKKSIVLVDGYFREPFNFEYKCIAKGDQKHYSIAAASILAKVYRDKLMYKLAKKFPYYGFETNVGYGTRKHRVALQRYGICEIHRRSYKPIRKVLKGKG